MSNKRFITMDNVTCNHCGFSGLIDPGQESCPQCGKDDALAWTDPEKQEVEL